MDLISVNVIKAVLTVSIIVWVIYIISFIKYKYDNRPVGDKFAKSNINLTIVFYLCLITSIWALRYAVGYYNIVSALEDAVTLTWVEEIANSFVHTLQTFSLGESYNDYMFGGKEMMKAVFGENTRLTDVYGIYSSVLNMVAPIAGGAIILEILVSFFPKLKLQDSYIKVWRDKYYFSELNKASLVLARSIKIAYNNKFIKPIIIFTDSYVDKQEENSAELMAEAKLLGAICVKDDLSHLKKNRFGKRVYFLLDKDETGTLQTLADLVNTSDNKYLKKSEIYIFTNDDSYLQVENNIYNKLCKEWKLEYECKLNENASEKEKKKEEKIKNKIEHKKEKIMPTFVPVQSHRNLISNLLVDIPLYEPIVGKEKTDGKKTLTVTVVGTGQIGTEMFLSTYWFGQILDCKLNINVISKESEDEFWGKIDFVNPEIKRTTIEGDSILLINRKGEKAEPYCNVNYIHCDVKSSAFISCLKDKSMNVLDTDYYLVALGNDDDNITVANTVKNFVGEHHIKNNKPVHTVIAYVVYDYELSKALNEKKFFSFIKDTNDVYMQAVGNFRDVYSVRNVFLSEHAQSIRQTHNAYLAIKNKQKRAKAQNKRLKDAYSYWSSLARALHIKYKTYSIGAVKKSLFDYPDKPEDYNKECARALKRYEQFAKGNLIFTLPNEETAHIQMLHKMAWLEHRRWNAFMRIKGFRGTTDFDAYAVSGKSGSYKQMDVKLHPCILECDQSGIRADISPNGEIDASTVFMCQDKDNFDLLDDLSYELHDKNYNDYDFKIYDYSKFDF